MARSRLHRRYGRRPRSKDSGPRHNPPLLSDLTEWIAPGFAGFAATRFLTYIAATQIAKRKPSLGKHAGAVASVGSFLAAWYLADKVKYLAKYQMPLVVGSGLAAVQSLLQLYVPKVGWIVSDATPELAAQQPQQQLPPGVTSSDQLREIDDDPNAYVYNDSFDAGRVSSPQQRADRQPAATDVASQTDEDLLAELDLEDQAGQAANLGIFGGG